MCDEGKKLTGIGERMKIERVGGVFFPSKCLVSLSILNILCNLFKTE